MRRRPDPTPEAPPIDAARIRQLVEALHAAHARGESLHQHDVAYQLSEAGGLFGAMYCTSMLNDPDGPRPCEAIVSHILKHAAEWLERQERY